jgi:isoleucyl-tRNA synthetase
MDLEDGAVISAYRPGAEGAARQLKLVAHKKLPRRVALLTAEDRAALGLSPAPSGLGTMPVEVPRLPAETRVSVEDKSKPAPGADAFRWFFYSSSPPWSNTRHSLTNVRLAQKDFLIKLRNVYSFFTIYANIDGWSPTDKTHAGRPARERNLLDRWMLGELALAVDKVRSSLESYMPYDAAACLVDLAESLSNWYVRRSRARFWGPGLEADKCDAYATLYEVLATLSRLIAPFTPFFAEELYQNLVVRPGLPEARQSVHLDQFPIADLSLVDQKLSEETRVVREIISLGLRVRTTARLKVRQPLSRADVVFADSAWQTRLQSYAELIKEELNVHEVRFLQGRDEGAVSFRLKPNFRALGPRLGKDVQAVKKALETADGARLYAELAEKSVARIEVNGNALELSPSELEVVVEAAPGFAAESGKVGVVVLHTVLTDELVDEGILREILSRIQAARKDGGLGFTDRIALDIDGSERVVRVARAGEVEIKQECLANSVRYSARGDAAETHDIGDEQLVLSLQKVTR